MNRQHKLKPVGIKVKKNGTDDLINNLIIDAIQDIKGKNIVKLDLTNLDDAPADYFIICEGESSTQIKSIVNRITRRLKEEAFLLPNHVEGHRNAQWICVDYFNIVVHVFYKEVRKFYELEELWSDAIHTEYQNIS